jgi:glycosyltransferase involved in cell wall biosynthesis
MKVALVASWLNQYGGAERVLEAVHELFPTAPVFTATYTPAALPAAYRTWDIRSSFLDRLPIKNKRLLLPLYPAAFESLDLRGYDRILSITSAFAHGVRRPASAQHTCYCLTPARFLWNYDDYVEREQIGRLPRLVLPAFITGLRHWDRAAAERVTQFVAISETVRERIAQCYRQEATIIHPPVDVDRFEISPTHEDFFLVLSRLVPYKRIDLAVQAFNQLGLPLVVAGEGRDRARLEAMARPNVRFVGRPSDAAAAELLACCRALIFPGEEDFGITPLEANACGHPTIAFAGGGARETILPGVTGEFFPAPTVACLAETVARFDDRRYDYGIIRQHAEKFSTRVFKERLNQLVNDER